MSRTWRTRRGQAALTVSIAIAAVVGAACGGGGSSKAATAHLSLPPAPEISGGGRFSLELLPNGSVLAWGHNSTGELGDGTATMRTTPVRAQSLPDGRRVVQVDAGRSHTLALANDGTVWAWGHNRSGQLGDGSRVDRPTPVRVHGLDDVRMVSAGDAFSVALKSDGTVLAWGNNESGQLGDGNAPIDHATPAPVHDLGPGSGVVQVVAGKSFALVRKADGTVLGWGNGTSGQLGDGANDKQSAPTPVSGLDAGSGVVDVAAGGSFSLAVKSDGTVLAWGNNKSGQLGDGSGPTDHNRPVHVKGLDAGSGVVAVSAGSSFSAALERDGTVLGWGRNKVGEVGDGTYDDRSTPVVVKDTGPKHRVVAIDLGSYHALALREDGELVAWGDNSSGQLGDGTAPTNQPTPVVVRLPAAGRT